jgi:hypothetical protein
MKAARAIVATAYVAATGLLLVWGAWLLATDDPDGGRHPVGAVIVVVALLACVLGLVVFRASRRR